eukprot:11224888-Alexandrium_andersonii.AAC.1
MFRHCVDSPGQESSGMILAVAGARLHNSEPSRQTENAVARAGMCPRTPASAALKPMCTGRCT